MKTLFCWVACTGDDLFQERARERFKMVQELDEAGMMKGECLVRGAGRGIRVLYMQFSYITILQCEGMKGMNSLSVGKLCYMFSSVESSNTVVTHWKAHKNHVRNVPSKRRVGGRGTTSNKFRCTHCERQKLHLIKFGRPDSWGEAPSRYCVLFVPPFLSPPPAPKLCVFLRLDSALSSGILLSGL